MYVFRLLSWASSSIITEYWSSSGLDKLSRRRTPSVRYLIRVLSEVLSSNLMAYPTSSPSRTLSSCETRLCTISISESKNSSNFNSIRDWLSLPGDGDGSDSARLSDADDSGLGVASSVKHLRELRALSRTGLSDYHHDGVLFNCFYDFLFELEDR